MSLQLSGINGRTALLGIFGDPVSHSLSPKMQNAALHAAAIDAVYLPLPVAAVDLPAAVQALRAFGFVGVNVTIPHKEAVMALLDQVDPQAKAIGAVNTIVNRDGVLCGYNTDASGFLHSLRSDLGFDPQGKRVVLLGAGGASRAAIVALAAAGAVQVVVANRTRSRAAALTAELSPHCADCCLVAKSFEIDILSEALVSADLLVNTTAVGLHGEVFEDGMLELLTPKAAVFDMVYTPQATALLNRAMAQGRAVADGRGMLVAQGEDAFVHWFGRCPPAGVMRAAIFEN